MSAAPTPTPRAGWRKIIALTLGLTALLAVMLVAFALPSARSGANNVPLGVVAPSTVSNQLSAGDHFDVTTYADVDAAPERQSLTATSTGRSSSRRTARSRHSSRPRPAQRSPR